MAGFQYGPWRPDVTDLNSPFSSEAKNGLPGTVGWNPFPSLSAISEALGATCRGAFVARTSTGSAKVYAATAADLFFYAGLGSGFTNATRLAGGTYSLPTNEYWSFDQFDDDVIAVQGGDAPQIIDVDSGTNFAALGGSPPTARYVKAVGDHLFLLDLTSAVGALPPSTGRIQAAWSAMRDAEFWTYGQRSSDTATFSAGGHVVGMSSPQTGLLIQQDAVNRYTKTTDRRVWDFAAIETAQGSKSPYSLIEHQGVLIYYGVDGFVASSAGAFTDEAGVEWIDEWFKDNCNQSRLGNIIGARDPTRPRFWWLFPTTNNASSLFLDHIIGFDKKLQRWFHGEVSASYLFTAATPGVTLENLGSAGLGYTLEAVPFSLDSPIWQGGTPQVGAFDSAQKMGFFTGTALEPLLRTGRLELIPGRRAYVNGWRPLTDATTVAGRIFTSETPQATPDESSEATVNEWGVIEQEVSGRYMTFETTIPAGATWTNVQGGSFDDDAIKSDGVS